MVMKSKLFFEWVKKIHMYAGLLTFTAFVVWGISGIHAVFLESPGEYKPPPVTSVREYSFKAPGKLDDEQTSKAIAEMIAVPMAGGRYNVHRDEQSNLAFNVFTINGGREVTFVESAGIVRVAHRANSTWSYLSSMHTAHSRRHRQIAAVRAWGYFNEFSTWAFLFMTISGLYLWIATRPTLRWAQLSLAGMAVLTVAMWVAIR
jgi:hypothetical protein